MGNEMMTPLSRTQAIKILDLATGACDWLDLVEDHYDEGADSWPSFQHVLAVLGVTEAEYKEATGAQNANWPIWAQPAAPSIAEKRRPAGETEPQKLLVEFSQFVPLVDLPEDDQQRAADLRERLWCALADVSSIAEKPSRIGESVVLHTVRQMMKEAAEEDLANGCYDASKSTERLLELIEEEVLCVAPAVDGAPPRDMLPGDIARGIKAMEDLQKRFLPSWEGGAATEAREVLLQAWARLAELESICAAMLQRWAVVHNLAQADGPDNLRHGSVFGVASLSAEEFVADGGRAGGARLQRQEAAARVLVEVAKHLQSAPIEPGSQLQEQIQQAAEQLSSYPQLSPVVVCKGVDVDPSGLKPGRIEYVPEN